MRKAILACALLVSSPAFGQTPLERLDRIDAEVKALRSVLTPVPPQAPTVIVVPLGGNVQAAIDNAAAGVEVRLAPGLWRVNLRITKSVTLRSDVPDAVLRLTPAGSLDPTVTGLARLIPADASQPIVTVPGSDVALVGLEIGGNDSRPDVDLVVLEGSRITVERSYIHGGVNGGHRGIALQSSDTKIRQNTISGFWEVGRDSQAIAGWNGPGPYLIESNYLEASGENLLFGGSDPRVHGLIPSDIVIRGNHLSKPVAWKQKRGSVKNLLELKNARRVLIENNLIERNWPDAQDGSGILFTTKNQDGGCAWCEVSDVTFQYNVIRDVEGRFLNLLGTDYMYPSAKGHDIVIRHNLCIRCTDGIISNSGFTRTTISNNTIPFLNWKFLQFSGSPTSGLVVKDNITASGAYGVIGDSTAPGTPSLTVWAPLFVFTGNVLTQALGVPYPAGNDVVTVLPLDSTLRYNGARIPAPGADVTELRRRIPWAVF